MGGVTDRATHVSTISKVAFFTTPLICGYILLFMTGVLDAASYSGPLAATLIASLWVALGLSLYVFPSKSHVITTVQFMVFLGLALATLAMVSGFNSPFAPMTALLFLAAYASLSWNGVILSVASIIVVATIDALLRAPFQPTIYIDNALGGLSIIVLGAAIVAILSTEELRQQALRKSQQRERLQYERTTTLINNLADAAISVDHAGVVRMYNAACLNLLDTNKSLKGLPLASLLNLTDTKGERVAIVELLKSAARSTTRDDLLHTFSDGEQIRLEITYAPIKGAFARRSQAADTDYIMILRDVTKRKSLEEERDEFISVVSHELRTPITIVEGTISNLGVLVDRPELPAQALLRSSLKTAHEQVVYLAKMVNDLSTLSRAERGVGDQAEYMDVQELLHEMFQRYEHEATAKGLRLELDAGTKLGGIFASRLYTEELLQNFITNAIKYTKEGSVTIIGTRHKNTVTFAVKDTGIGISRGDQAKVFDKFYRSEDYRIRETGGTGLGLYVSAKLAHKLHTKIELSSRLNHGSTFSFSLPNTEDAPSN